MLDADEMYKALREVGARVPGASLCQPLAPLAPPCLS